jgi:MFS family permease
METEGRGTTLSTSINGGAAAYEAHEGGNISDSNLKLTRQTFIFALCAAVNSCNLGYDVGVSTNAGALIQNDMGLTNVQREIFIGSLNLWSIFGSLFAHWICDRYGRRHSFKVAAIGFIIGSIIMASATNYTVLMVGRVFVGLGVGFGLAIDPLYIAEISPAEHRGRLVTWSEIAINVGLVFGFFSGIMFYGVADDLQWRLMFAMGCILPIVMIILVQTVMPESPRFLVEKQRIPEARQILKTLYPEGNVFLLQTGALHPIMAVDQQSLDFVIHLFVCRIQRRPHCSRYSRSYRA